MVRKHIYDMCTTNFRYPVTIDDRDNVQAIAQAIASVTPVSDLISWQRLYADLRSRDQKSHNKRVDVVKSSRNERSFRIETPDQSFTMRNEACSRSPSVTHKTYLIMKDTIESTIRRIDLERLDNIAQTEIQEMRNPRYSSPFCTRLSY